MTDGPKKKLIHQTEAADKRTISDTTLRMLEKRRAPDGLRVYIRDDKVNGFAIRVTERGSLSYVFEARVKGIAGTTRRTIGKVRGMSLAAARARAKAWADQIGEGKDPKQEERKVQEVEAAERAATFASVAEAFIASELRLERKGAIVAREIRKELVDNPALGPRPIARIEQKDIVKCLKEIRDRHEGGVGSYARNIYGHGQRIFSWAIQADCYGLKRSPFEHISASGLFGKKRKRKRVLNDDELRALWRAASREKIYGSLLKWLLLTAVRKENGRTARRREFNRKVWHIPQGKAKTDQPYVVPLTAAMLEFYDALPRFNKAKQDFLFTLDGELAFNGMSKAKARLERRMTWVWRALARLRGDEDRRGVEIPNWNHHDLRRTVRTRLAKLRVPYEIAELAIGHGKAGLQDVYDQHTYEDEIREAFEKWNVLLLSIVERAAPPSNVVKLRGKAK